MRAMTHDRLVLTNANVIDCVGEQTIANGAVAIEREVARRYRRHARVPRGGEQHGPSPVDRAGPERARIEPLGRPLGHRKSPRNAPVIMALHLLS